jgi:hypothetical protein
MTVLAEAFLTVKIENFKAQYYSESLSFEQHNLPNLRK